MKRSPSIGHSPSRDVRELEDRLLREHERVLVGGRAADEDRLAVAQADDDAALVEGDDGPSRSSAPTTVGLTGGSARACMASSFRGWRLPEDATPARYIVGRAASGFPRKRDSL